MKIIQSQNSKSPSFNPTLAYSAFIFIFFGLNYIINFIRPIINLYIIYFDLDWAEFQILELFDILNLIFGIFLIILGLCLFYYKKFTRALLIFGGMIFFLYNIINPSHFLIFGSLISLITGNPPVWMSVIPDNLLGIYLCSWSVLSFSNILLQIIGIYIAFRIIQNSNPQRAIIQFLFFYCWITGISGIILCLQSILVITLTASWSSITIIAYIFRLGTWICMSMVGIMGLIFIWHWLKNQIRKPHIKFGQISLISFAIMLIFISFSDFAMKLYFSLGLNSLIAGLLFVFALKIPKFLKLEKMERDSSLSKNNINQICVLGFLQPALGGRKIPYQCCFLALSIFLKIVRTNEILSSTVAQKIPYNLMNPLIKLNLFN